MTAKVPLPGITKLPAKMSEEVQKSPFPKNSNPFYVVTDWKPELFEHVTVRISDPTETTNDFTRLKSKTARYWVCDVGFEYTDPNTNRRYKSGIMKMTDCDVPYVNSQNYGTNFFYSTCNRHIGDAIIKAAAKKNMLVSPDDERVISNPNQWWKTINKVDGRVGTLDADANFRPVDLHELFARTENGIKASLDVVAKLKFSTKDGSNIRQGSQFRIAFDLSRGLIKGLNNNVAPPMLESSIEIAPVRKTDVTSADLAEELSALGL